MTVDWIDTPGSTLASRSESIDFSVSGELPFVSVRFASDSEIAEELAYRDGAFLYPYLGSSREGDAVSLVRTGGWPAAPTVHVEEQATTAWTTLYDRDLRTLSNQTVQNGLNSVYRAFTASDGSQWSFHGSSGACMIVNGTGMVLTTDSRQLTYANNAYAGLRACLLVNELAGFDPQKQTAVQVRFDGTLNSSELGSTAWWGSATWGYGPGANNVSTKLTATLVTAIKFTAPGNADWDAVYPYARANVINEPAAGWVTGSILSPLLWGGRVVQGLYRDGADPVLWPVIEDMQSAGSYRQAASTGNPLHMGFYLGMAGGNVTRNGTHIRVLQKPL